MSLVFNDLQVGDLVKDSPNGPGTITSISSAGFPEVNGVCVAVLIREDGAVWNPLGLPMEQVVAQWREVDAAKEQAGSVE